MTDDDFNCCVFHAQIAEFKVDFLFADFLPLHDYLFLTWINMFHDFWQRWEHHHRIWYKIRFVNATENRKWKNKHHRQSRHLLCLSEDFPISLSLHSSQIMKPYIVVFVVVFSVSIDPCDRTICSFLMENCKHVRTSHSTLHSIVIDIVEHWLVVDVSHIWRREKQLKF